MFTKHNVFTEGEIHSRYEILLDGYYKTINIEALTMVNMVKSSIIPACLAYQSELAWLLERKKACGEFDVSVESHLLEKISKLSTSMLKSLNALENVLIEASKKDKVFIAMSELRIVVDELETLVAGKHWPFPTYAEILYSVV